MSEYNHRNKIFKRFYEDLGRKRDLIDNDGLGDTYKRVLDEYNHCMDVEEYIVSFLLIQNLLEDRIYVLYKNVFEFKKKSVGLQIDQNLSTYHKNNSLNNVVSQLNEWGVFKPDLFMNLLTCTDIRNKQIHYSFMDINSFDKELSESYYQLFREVDKLVQKFKRKTRLY
jgi:hypothetical protein